MIALGCDHGGYELKQEIIKYLEENNLPFKDFGCYDNSSVDYPIYARKVTDAITHGECDKGILICGTGIGSLHRQQIRFLVSALHCVLTASALKPQDFTMMLISFVWADALLVLDLL